jgi:hypothetical protein
MHEATQRINLEITKNNLARAELQGFAEYTKTTIDGMRASGDECSVKVAYMLNMRNVYQMACHFSGKGEGPALPPTSMPQGYTPIPHHLARPRDHQKVGGPLMSEPCGCCLIAKTSLETMTRTKAELELCGAKVTITVENIPVAKHLVYFTKEGPQANNATTACDVHADHAEAVGYRVVRGVFNHE